MLSFFERWSKQVGLNPDYPHVFLPSVAFGLLVSLFAWLAPQPPMSDARFYREIALGSIELVQQPFSGRILHPLLVLITDRLTPLSVDQSFFAVGILLIFALSYGLFWLRRHFHISLLYFIPLCLTPVLFFIGRDYYLTDLAHSTALVAFFIAASKKGLTHWSTLALLVVSFFIRESTLLLAVACLGLLGFRRSWNEFAKFAVTSVFAWVAVGFVSHLGQPNIHNLPSSIYLLLKVPFNGLHNLLGITLTSNTLNENAGRTICEVVKTITVPALTLFGGLKTVSLCRPDVNYPLHTLLLALTELGTAPLLLIWIARKETHLLRQNPQLMTITLLYGLLAFCLAPLFGSSVDRLLAMGWPVFLIVIPFLYTQRSFTRYTLAFWLCPLFAWIGMIFLPEAFTSSLRLNLQVGGTIIVYATTYALLRDAWRTGTTVTARALQTETAQNP